MSVWSSLAGSITVPNSSRFGIKDLIEIHFPEAGKPHIEFVNTYNDRKVFKVSLNIDYEGDHAAKRINTFVKECRKLDMGVDITAEVRY